MKSRSAIFKRVSQRTSQPPSRTPRTLTAASMMIEATATAFIVKGERPKA
jgi:hypothetical protein